MSLETNIRELALAAMKASEITPVTRFDSTGHAEPWRNTIAIELNLLLEISRGLKYECHKGAIRSIIARVAEFEEIKTV